MSEYVDIHSHLLPGLDDGPDSLEKSLDMARAAASVGTGTIAATPHLRHDFPGVHVHELSLRCLGLSAAIEQHGIPVAVVSGAEVSAAWALGAVDEELALASYGQRGTDLLLETPTTNAVAIEPVVAYLVDKGYRVTLAHPERGLSFQRNQDWLRPLVDRGLLLAVNAGSLLAGRTSHPGSLARFLVNEGLAHVIASDGHRAAHWRPITVLEQGVEAAAALVGPERARWMTEDAPRAILEGTALPDAPPLQPQRRRRRLFR